MELTAEVMAVAWKLVPHALRLVGDSSPRDAAQLAASAAALAQEKGVETEFRALAQVIAEEEVPLAAGQVAAYWAARRVFGVDPRTDRELAGPTDDELHSQELELAANAAEAETRRFYREDFPAIAAARGERPEDSAGWREFAGQGESAPPPPAPPRPLSPIDIGSRCDWPEDAIRADYRRFMSAAERSIFNAALETALPFVPERTDAARYAMYKVIERRRQGRSAA